MLKDFVDKLRRTSRTSQTSWCVHFSFSRDVPASCRHGHVTTAMESSRSASMNWCLCFHCGLRVIEKPTVDAPLHDHVSVQSVHFSSVSIVSPNLFFCTLFSTAESVHRHPEIRLASRRLQFCFGLTTTVGVRPHPT